MHQKKGRFMKNAFLKLMILGFILSASSSQSEVRAIIDMGSGSTKMKIFDFKSTSQVTELKKCKRELPVAVKNTLTSDLTIPEVTQAKLIEVVKSFVDVARSSECSATQIVAIGTAAYREAKNGTDVMTRIENEVGSVKAQVLSWEDEAMLGFIGVEAKLGNKDEEKCVWDIGAASMQITCKVDGLFVMDLSSMASVPFRNLVIKEQTNFFTLKKNYPTTPNPLVNESKSVKRSSKKINKLFSQLNNSENLKNLPVYGIGGVHNYSANTPLNRPENGYTVPQLENLLADWRTKSDNDLVEQKISSADFASTQVTNTLLILAVMQAAEIKSVKFVDSGLFDGALRFEKLWLP